MEVSQQVTTEQDVQLGVTVNEPATGDHHADGEALLEEENMEEQPPVPDLYSSLLSPDDLGSGDSDDSYFSVDELAEDTLFENHKHSWIEDLTRYDRISLSLLLHRILVKQYGTSVSKSDETIAATLNVTVRTIRNWRREFIENEGCISDILQGKYARPTLWQNEELNLEAKTFIRQNASVPGKPNLTAAAFCDWVNNDLLPRSELDPAMPTNIGVVTANRWMHELGFSIIQKNKGIYIDGHERNDVVANRSRFLRKMTAIGFLKVSNAPSEVAAACLDDDLLCTDPENSIIIFHDESIFCSNEDQSTQWGFTEDHFVRPKSKGSGIMVSDFINEEDGYLRLSDEFEEARQLFPNIRKEARELLEYGGSKEGYWNSERFLGQMKVATDIAKFKYSRHGKRVYWVFDHSSCHTAFGPDALNVLEMNVKPGGGQPKMRNTVYKGKLQKMNFDDGTPKGLKRVLEERGIRTTGMNKQDMQAELASHSDFKDERTMIEHFLHGKGQGCIFLPKFHCELNPIERCWGQAKKYTRAHCNYTLAGLRKIIPKGLNSVSLEI